MMRLPWFAYRAPRTAAEAARILAGEGANAMPIAGGTDLLPNMKRRQQVPATLVSLRHVEGMKKLANGTGLALGAGLTLTEVAEAEVVRAQYRALWQAAAQVATVHLRNMG
ncbi:MAG: FAD binding domain-containing protein, partial [Burkholderiales bacterium]